MVDGSLKIYNMSKPALMGNNNNYFNIQQMKKDKMLSLETEENVIPYGNGTKVEETKSETFLVKTPLSYKAQLLMFSKNEKNTPKIQVHAGPAGTGKTETFKDFAVLSGYKAIVNNCSDEMTENDIKNIFLDVNNKDSLCVFDEFNRLTAQTMKFFFEHLKTLNAAKFLMVCLTFNPGYLGRTIVLDK